MGDLVLTFFHAKSMQENDRGIKAAKTIAAYQSNSPFSRANFQAISKKMEERVMLFGIF